MGLARPTNSRTRIDKAGETIRGWLTGDIDLAEDELKKEVDVIDDFRTCHADPLTRVAAGIRYYVVRHSSAKINGRPVVAQRLKRMRTIADKLLRQPDMRLSQMYDVGGCRALFGSVDEIRATIEHLERQKRWTIRRVRDYVVNPKPRSGYRAIHVIAQKEGLLIEIQLRTVSQHAWAELIERTDRSTEVGLKTDQAPDDVTEYYRLGADLWPKSTKARAGTRRRYGDFKNCTGRCSANWGEPRANDAARAILPPYLRLGQSSPSA